MNEPEQIITSAQYAAPPVPPPYPLRYGQEPSLRSRSWNGFLTATASLWLAGLGHWLAHDRRRGAKWFAAYVGLTLASLIVMSMPPLVPAMIVLVPLGMLVTLVCAIDAWRSARRHSVPPRFPNAALRLLTGVAFLAATATVPPTLPLALLMRATLVETFVMPSESMAPILLPGDRFAVHKCGKWDRWDVVAFHFPEDPAMKFVMRVVGLPGERVEIVDGAVTIDGQSVEPPHGVGPYVMDDGIERWLGRRGNGCEGNPMTLADDEYFVLGDDSLMARDSRTWRDAPPGHQSGAVPADMIIGRATWTYWPPSRWSNLEPPR